MVKQISRWTHSLDTTMRRKTFSGMNPEDILAFLSTLRRKLDDAGLLEATRLRIWPSFLSGAAQQKFKTYFEDQAAGLNTWLTAVYWFL